MNYNIFDEVLFSSYSKTLGKGRIICDSVEHGVMGSVDGLKHSRFVHIGHKQRM